MNRIALLALLFASVLSVGFLTRTYTVNVYGDAPLEITVSAEVLHDTDASLPITAKLK